MVVASASVRRSANRRGSALTMSRAFLAIHAAITNPSATQHTIHTRET